jgi:hypothetical protein
MRNSKSLRRRRERRAKKFADSTALGGPTAAADSLIKARISSAAMGGITMPACSPAPPTIRPYSGDASAEQAKNRRAVAAPTAMKTVAVVIGDRVENVEVPCTGDVLYDEAVAFLRLAGTTNLTTRGCVDRVCGNIARRFASPDIAADPEKWRKWQRRMEIPVQGSPRC